MTAGACGVETASVSIDRDTQGGLGIDRGRGDGLFLRLFGLLLLLHCLLGGLLGLLLGLGLLGLLGLLLRLRRSLCDGRIVIVVVAAAHKRKAGGTDSRSGTRCQEGAPGDLAPSQSRPIVPLAHVASSCRGRA